MPFNVNTATILTVTPASGVPGTPVTIAGSSFGAAQGGGQVWLGTANAVVQSWSDTQIVALVASGSASGNALVLQNGVMSNPVPFAVNTLQLTSIDPNSGAAGTAVTFTGAGFGSSQGSGVAWLGSTAGQVVSWSDTQVVATVASTAVTGIARIQQNGVWSNALAFTVPAENGVTLMPSVLNLMVGDTHAIQALSAAGQPVTGLTWTSSDPTVVSLSSDDPPLLTALAAGHVTITAGTASADVTVSSPTDFPGGLPLGTVLWSHPGDVNRIVPAVPSPSGVADVFAISDGTIQAITSDGTTAWTAGIDNLDQSWEWADFQGGLVIINTGDVSQSVIRLDGATGQRTATVTIDQPPDAYRWVYDAAVHPDGTIFAVVQTAPDCLPGSCSGGGAYFSVMGIDPSGGQKFTVKPVDTPIDGEVIPGNIIVAGDGYAYVTYVFHHRHCPDPSEEMKLVRISSTGAYDDILIQSVSGYVDLEWPGLITNADTGTLVTYSAIYDSCADPETDPGHEGYTTQMMAITTGTGVSVLNAPTLGGTTPVEPDLQAQDGSFVGTTYDDSSNEYMIAFDQAGGVRWTVPNYSPLMATADGGVIATSDGVSATIFDQNGGATGQMANMPTYSWKGDAYQIGSVEQVVQLPLYAALGFWSFVGGNNSGNGTAVKQQWFPPLTSCTDKAGNCQGPLGPADLLWNAKADLVNQLTNDQTCSEAAKQYILGKIPYGFFQSPIVGSDFISYIQGTRRFYDGTKSTYDLKDAKCGEALRINCTGYNPPRTVKQEFQPSSGTRITALTVTPSKPLKTFWQPAYTGPDPSDPNDPNFTGFGVGIDPSRFGANIYNESHLFHEALHGITGYYDEDLQGLLGIAKQSDSTNISIEIKNKVLSKCPTFRR